MRRQAGVVLPLFAIRTRRDWGIGQITDLPACAAWVRRAGQGLLQVLPPHTLSPGETSPYGALTAFGIDPIYADIDAIEDIDAQALDEAMDSDGRSALAHARAAARVDYSTVRAIKMRAFDVAFDRFVRRDWSRQTARATRFADFMRVEKNWLDDLSLYEVLRASHGGWGWKTWPEEERDRDPSALGRLRADHSSSLLKVAYTQWTLSEQWQSARRHMRGLGVELMGDVPFVVGGESADVWSHAAQFQLQLSLGAPPDDFSSDGQDWGLPAYDWLAMEADDLEWIRMRARHAARMYDRFRLDHVVGYFRQWVRRKDGRDRGRFDPEGAGAQRARGRRVLGAVLDELHDHNEPISAPRAIAEDLGVIPNFVRESLMDLGMPGYRVVPWERDADIFRDPRDFPSATVVTWSTHDTAPIDGWWSDLPERDRVQLGRRASVSAGPEDDVARSIGLLREMYLAKSDLALVLIQELLGLKDRINTPATVGPQNWTWRLPRPLEDLADEPFTAARFDAIRDLARASGR